MGSVGWRGGLVLAAMVLFGPAALAQSQADTPPPQGTSRGENFSAKPAPQLFASDCTGAGCHKGPQGLGKGMSQGSLAGFLREHYTNSRESASALAAYLVRQPAAAQPERPSRASAPSRSGGPSWFDPEPQRPEPPKPTETRTPRQQPASHPAARSSRAAATPADAEAPKPVTAPEAKPAPAEQATPADRRRRGAEAANQRGSRGRQPAPAAAAAPPPEPAAPEPPPAPTREQFDIFD